MSKVKKTNHLEKKKFSDDKFAFKSVIRSTVFGVIFFIGSILSRKRIFIRFMLKSTARRLRGLKEYNFPVIRVLPTNPLLFLKTIGIL